MRGRVLGLASLLLAAHPAAGQQSLLPDTPVSPSVVRLAADLERIGSSATAAFWQDVEARGAPLVEPDMAYPGHSLVTFVYREPDNETEVALASNIVSLDRRGDANPSTGLTLARLPGSDVLFVTFRLRNDIRAPYSFRLSRPGREPELVTDALNPVIWEPEQSALRSSIIELPGAPPQPWRDAGAEAGDWDELELEDAAGATRTVYVYKPAGWRADPTRPYPALVALGSYGTGIGMRVDWMADHLIDTGVLPTMVFLLLDVDGEATRYEATDAFVADVVLPYAREHYAVSRRPEDVAVSGTSRRGLIAAMIGLRRPESVGKVISLSGSFYWRPTDEREWVWMASEYARHERRPIRLYVAAGELETFLSPGVHGHYMVGTNRHFRDVLRAREYEFVYIEFNGVHSDLNWQDWLADGLTYLFGTSPR